LDSISFKIKTKVIPLYKHKTFLYITSIAACAAIIFSVTLTKSSISNTINDVQISNIDDYIERGNLDLDTYDLMAMLGDEEIEEISAENIIFSEDNLEDYLMDNLDDTSLLTE
jgi:hypothetical protein